MEWRQTDVYLLSFPAKIDRDKIFQDQGSTWKKNLFLNKFEIT